MNGRARTDEAAPDDVAAIDEYDTDIETTERDADLLVDAVVEAADELPSLTERELQILAFERQWWRHAGAKEQAIRDTFDLSSTRYYQVLNGLLENPAALAVDPLLVKRLRRLRQARRRTR
jgi:hypothetical protein